MKQILLVTIFFTFALSCSKDSKDSGPLNACNSDNPLEIPWLKEMKNSLQNCRCEVSIIQGTYKEQTVFFTALTDPVCDGIDTPTLFNCNGKPIRTFSEKDYHDFYDEVTLDKVLYRCKTTQ